MTSNPYQPPSIPSLEPPAESGGISHEDYLQFRRASALMTTTIAVFFLLFGVQMIQHSMFVEAGIASGFCVAMLICAAGILMRRTSGEARLTLKKYRSVSSSMRQLCFWLGPLMLVVGILQAACVPTMCQCNPWGFVVCGVAATCCAFQWPRTGLIDQEVSAAVDVG